MACGPAIEEQEMPSEMTTEPAFSSVHGAVLTGDTALRDCLSLSLLCDKPQLSEHLLTEIEDLSIDACPVLD